MKTICLLTCSDKKLNVPAPAFMLYGSSPRFSLFYQHAVSLGTIYILSGLHGLVSFDTILKPYDHLLNLKEQPTWLKENAKKINALQPEKIISFLSGDYKNVIPLVTCTNVVNMLSGSMFMDAKLLGPIGRLKTQAWPTQKIIKFVYDNSPVKINEVIVFIRSNWKNEHTRKRQLMRTIKCPLFMIQSDELIYRFNPKE
jgi:hypothetical protein